MNIIVIDDNESIANMLQQFLEIKGHNCITSRDGRNALSLISRKKFDVIILDLAMPEFSGWNIINELEKTGKLKEQNIIVLTASAISSEQSDSLLKQGIKSCLRKPVTPDILLKTITSL